jgi:hypothetical protein
VPIWDWDGAGRLREALPEVLDELEPFCRGELKGLVAKGALTHAPKGGDRTGRRQAGWEAKRRLAEARGDCEQAGDVRDARRGRSRKAGQATMPPARSAIEARVMSNAISSAAGEPYKSARAASTNQ